MFSCFSFIRVPRSRDKLERTKSSPVGSVTKNSLVGSDIIKSSLVGCDNLGTKRQKLEIGFLKKVHKTIVVYHV